MALKIIQTSDGSHTIYDESLNETYHSIHGSINESNHVYVNAGLKQFIYESRKKHVNILEVGFGTGLNFLLLYDFLKKRNIKVDYHTIEPNPLNDSVLEKLNFSKIIGSVDEIFKIIHKSKTDELVEIDKKITFLKSVDTIENIKLKERKYDIIFFDAFAPSKQPDIWSYNNLNKIHSSMGEDSILVTYCSSGKFKKTLHDLGFKVEVLDGPKGKKEMVRVRK
ncbi:MAG: tRNA (5-methylaminomethyl-2-thiouridine)(34)-methyltransferase MnmD [Bacteroidota bacterium]|jgi:tRNA U34 5-methylaminomethyl-2-thiouridine-forming methyltransferase MnmC|nr:tRNA (5-methylaminomethyl-2-thiouridine)(34)-methyltransferase MnmD [Bacteroidota bacterium]